MIQSLDTVILCLRLFPGMMKTYDYKRAYTRMFTAALFMVARS